MPALNDPPAEFEGQIFAIPEHLVGRRGQVTEWVLRIVGAVAIVAGFSLIWPFTIRTLAGAFTAVALLAGGRAAFFWSWNVRCRRFGWRLKYFGTGQYIDAKEPRPRLAQPAPGTPADIEDARTSFALGRVRRLDGTSTW